MAFLKFQVSINLTAEQRATMVERLEGTSGDHRRLQRSRLEDALRDTIEELIFGPVEEMTTDLEIAGFKVNVA